ncbi:MAG: universal stress protein [Rhodospirillales bacterium]|nr:universal stress protein [Rhodospirillales bacterium]
MPPGRQPCPPPWSAPDFGTALVGGFFKKDFGREALEHLGKELERFAETHLDADSKHQAHLGQGAIPAEAIRVAEAQGVDLIVMASHPPEEVQDFRIGSNADRVVCHSPIPVLVVRG